MAELRKDYVLNEWVIIATERLKRPQEFEKKTIKEKTLKKDKKCFFCPGNEHLTPPEIYRVGEKKWKIRVFPNKFPAVTSKSFKKQKGFTTKLPAIGQHEVIVETPRHDLELSQLPVKQIKLVLETYRERFKKLFELKKTREVNIFKNHGPGSGASIKHSHTQIISLNKLSTRTMQEKKRFLSYKKRTGKCIYCETIKKETKSPRKIQDKKIVVFTPFASKWMFELVLLPKKHRENMLELKPKELTELALTLKKALKVLSKINAPYNYYLHQGKKTHMHLRIVPRLSTYGGFEEQTGITINTVSPEMAAKFYRKKWR